MLVLQYGKHEILKKIDNSIDICKKQKEGLKIVV